MEPPIVDRTSEMESIRDAMSRVEQGEGFFLLMKGEAGIGKTRLLQEALAEARRRNFAVGRGFGVQGSVNIYQPLQEAFREIGLDHLFEEEAPPFLKGILIATTSGKLAAQAIRDRQVVDSYIWGAMTTAVVDYLRETLNISDKFPNGKVSRFAHGQYGYCILHCNGFTINSIITGRENERLIQDLRELGGRIESEWGQKLRQWDGMVKDLEGLEIPLKEFVACAGYDGADLELDGSARRYNLYENILHGLRLRCGQGPVLIALDDLQWADPSSLNMLLYISRNMRQDRLLLVGTYQIEKNVLRRDLAEALIVTSMEDIAVVISLGGLTKEDSRSVVENLLGPVIVPEELATEVILKADGNPLFIREMLTSFHEKETMIRDSAGAAIWAPGPPKRLEIPEKLKNVVERRLDPLSRDDRTLLDAAAVCGTLFHTGLLSRLLESSEPDLLRNLTSISRSNGFVHPEAGAWAFDHHIVREVLYEAVPPELRTLYHRMAAEGLETMDGLPEEIAMHFFAAHDQRAVPYLVRIGEIAMARGSHEEASRLFEDALELSPMAELSVILQKQVDALETGGMLSKAASTLETAHKIAAPALRGPPGLQTAPSTQDIVRLMVKRAWVQMRMGNYDECHELAEKAQGKAPLSDISLKGDAMTVLGLSLAHLAHPEDAISLLDSAHAMHERAGNLSGVAASLDALGEVWDIRGDFQKAMENRKLALELHISTGNRRGMAYSLNGLGISLMKTGELESGREKIMMGLSILEMLDDIYGIAMSLGNLGRIFASGGDKKGAHESFKKAIDIFEALNIKARASELLDLIE